LALASAKSVNGLDAEIWHLQVPKSVNFPVSEFYNIGFTQHRTIFEKVKDRQERFFYIRLCAEQNYTVEELKQSIERDDYHHQGSLPNNFVQTLPAAEQAFKAINTFKDEYLLDFINVEEIGVRDSIDVDERVVEKEIVNKVKNFIMTIGRDFTFMGNQQLLEVYGVEHFPDLLFFNRELNAMVVIELKTGEFKTSYLGQLMGYLTILDEKVRKHHENPSIGIVLCRSANREYVEFMIRDYSKPMGVATYKTADEMPENMRKALPDIDALKKLISIQGQNNKEDEV
jgi:predicted nuclease of restriction endonuclease-like (RecB) superfamily